MAGPGHAPLAELGMGGSGGRRGVCLVRPAEFFFDFDGRIFSFFLGFISLRSGNFTDLCGS